MISIILPYLPTAVVFAPVLMLLWVLLADDSSDNLSRKVVGPDFRHFHDDFTPRTRPFRDASPQYAFHDTPLTEHGPSTPLEGRKVTIAADGCNELQTYYVEWRSSTVKRTTIPSKTTPRAVVDWLHSNVLEMPRSVLKKPKYSNPNVSNWCRKDFTCDDNVYDESSDVTMIQVNNELSSNDSDPTLCSIV